MKTAIVYNQITSQNPDDVDTENQVNFVSEMLTQLGHQVHHIEFGQSITKLESQLMDYQPDFIFNLVESAADTDRLLYVAPAVFEFLHIPYSGCKSSTLCTLSKKTYQKMLLQIAGLPTPLLLDQVSDQHTELPQKWIIKSNYEHASFGLDEASIVNSISKARLVLDQKNKKNPQAWFAEAYIPGREFNISLLQDENTAQARILPHAEIQFTNATTNIVDYQTKWAQNSFNYNNTPRSFDFTDQDQPLLDQLSSIAQKCWRLFELSGAARVDFRVDKQNKPWVLEVNANPCLSLDAGFMAACQKADLSPQSIIAQLIPRRI